MRKYASVGVAVPQVLLPRKGVDLSKWSVVACDQFTSQPEYWKKVAAYTDGAPSTLNLIYPEVFLCESNPEARIASIRSKMDEYLTQGILAPHEGMVYVERETRGKVRKGLVVCIDLEHYDYGKGSTSLIRATEGTILDRIPPRIKIREGAKLELPHIMVLMDDPDNRVLGPLTEQSAHLDVLYDVDLMLDSGHLKGYRVSPDTLEQGVIAALERLAEPDAFRAKYGLSKEAPVLLFAMGDGNHSLATAKAIWEKAKQAGSDTSTSGEPPQRYALVELVNVHDPALEFEPIHRVVFDIDPDRDLLEEMKARHGDGFEWAAVSSWEEVKTAVDRQEPDRHSFGVISASLLGVVRINRPESNLAAGSLQSFLDPFMDSRGAAGIDYVHGAQAVMDLGKQKKNMGFYLPAMDKNDLFKTVILDGALPRKTFSMGEADEKRFYMECRRIG